MRFVLLQQAAQLIELLDDPTDPRVGLVLNKGLRLALAEHLASSDHLRTDPWRAAVEAVPRHEFLRGGYFERADSPGSTAGRPVLPEGPGWLGACYEDVSLVTQIAGTITPRDIRGEILREPTSSSTLPGLVVRMLEDFQVEDGNRAWTTSRSPSPPTTRP